MPLILRLKLDAIQLKKQGGLCAKNNEFIYIRVEINLHTYINLFAHVYKFISTRI